VFTVGDLVHSKRRVSKRPSSVFEAIEDGVDHGQVDGGKRRVKQRTAGGGGDAALLNDSRAEAARRASGPNLAGGPNLGGSPKSDGRRRYQFENFHLCQSCWDGGELVMCDYCPVSLCFGCAGVEPAGLGPSWRCTHHSCVSCGRGAVAAGGMLFRCAECPEAWCEECLPPDARVINQSARFTALGFVTPKSACYVLCSERCRLLASDHHARGL